MVLHPTNVLDVIERVGPVAQEALIDRRMLLTRDRPVHHDEMAHIMAGRRLMALRAVLRRGRGMQEARDFPGGESVAIRAFTPE